MMTMLYKKLEKAFPGLQYQENFLMSKVTYFKVGGPAEVFVEVPAEKDFVKLLQFCRREKIHFTILGGASNVIVADEGIKGLVIRYTGDSFTVIKTESSYALVEVNTGIRMPKLVRKTVDLGLTGLEYFLGVPGLLGGAIFNNAHYLSDLIGEHVEKVKVLNKDNEVVWLSNQECDFAYDKSRFQNSGEVILSVQFRLKPGTREDSLALIQKATEYRANTQPLGLPSSGCIFQNVPNSPHLQKLFPQFADKKMVPGGFIIDRAGLKGKRQGDIEVSEKHAAFFVNRGQGTSEDLKKLIAEVKSQVQEKFDVKLQEEVFYLG